jgi:hypothetical protein
MVSSGAETAVLLLSHACRLKATASMRRPVILLCEQASDAGARVPNQQEPSCRVWSPCRRTQIADTQSGAERMQSIAQVGMLQVLLAVPSYAKKLIRDTDHHKEQKQRLE